MNWDKLAPFLFTLKWFSRKSPRRRSAASIYTKIARHFPNSILGRCFWTHSISLIIASLSIYLQPLAMVRSSWKGRGQLFTEFGISVRTVKEDQSGTVCFIWNISFFLPIVLWLAFHRKTAALFEMLKTIASALSMGGVSFWGVFSMYNVSLICGRGAFS